MPGGKVCRAARSMMRKQGYSKKKAWRIAQARFGRKRR